jgi:hypothetical protein
VADPQWIKKTVAVSILLGIPAVLLLSKVWRSHNRANGRWSTNAALWTGMLFTVTYLSWIVNVTFEWSAFAMVLWPLCGAVLSVVGFVLGLFSDRDQRLRLIGANALFLVISLFSIVVPN